MSSPSAAGLTLPPPAQSAAPDTARALAQAAVDSLARFGLSPTPDHFAIWYDYHAEANHMVRRVIDTYLTNRRAIDATLMLALHERFFSPRSEAAALLETAQRLQEAMRETLAAAGQASADARRFGATLTGAGQAIVADPGHLPGIIDRLAAETRDIARRSEQIGERLARSVDRVETLERTLAESRMEATTDALTGLPNRRAFDDMLRLQADQARTGGAPLSLLIADIDRFKVINDTWGHPVGDAVLRRVAITLREHLAEPAQASRFGGEEFCVLVPGASPTAAVALAERLREAVAAQSFQVRASGKVLGRVTVSIGVADHAAGEAVEALIARADAALYRAKQAGRNRVERAAPN